MASATFEKLEKDISVDVQYVASFSDPQKGKAIAASMYQDDIDVIYQAAGGSGAGVFQEATARNQQLNQSALADDKVWVIGVDSDQEEEGVYQTADGKEDNFTLCSTLKGVDAVVQDISNLALKDEFPGGELLTYGLADSGVDMTEGYLSDEAKQSVAEAKQAIIDEEIKVAETPA